MRPAVVPPEIREEFVRKYYDKTNKVLKLPMTATFEFLKCLGNEAEMRFFEKEKEIKKIQGSRNGSLLAHGIRPVSERAAGSIWETGSDFLKFKNGFDFPMLP